jgi:hypothetical protein
VLGVSTAAIGRIEVGDTGWWIGVPSAVIEELVESGKPGATAHKQREQQECVQSISQAPSHLQESTWSVPGLSTAQRPRPWTTSACDGYDEAPELAGNTILKQAP